MMMDAAMGGQPRSALLIMQILLRQSTMRGPSFCCEGQAIAVMEAKP